MQTYYIHPDNPQDRIIAQVVQALKDDQLIVYPDAHGYQLALSLNAKSALEQAQRMAGQSAKAVLICQDLSQISHYAEVTNFAHRVMKNKLGTGIDFALIPTKATPKKLVDDKSKTIAVRIATTPIVTALLDKLGEPFVSLPIIIANEVLTYYSNYEVEIAVENLVDCFMNAGELTQAVPTLIDISQDDIVIVQQGDAAFEA